MLSKLVFALAAFILIYTAWFWAGISQMLLFPSVVAAGLLLVVLALAPSTFSLQPSAFSLIRDPLFWLGLLFLIYLGLQWWNAGRVLFFDVGLKKWAYSLPLHSHLPSAFSRAEAAQMLTWFFPAWVLILVARSPTLNVDRLRRLLLILVYSSGLLALFGIVQYATRTQALYGLVLLDCGFFASFCYVNHAAAYFNMIGALAAGLLFHELFFCETTVSRTKVAGLSIALVLCLTGAMLSLSRAGILFALALVVCTVSYGLFHGWRRGTPSGRVNMLAATIGLLCVGYFIVAGAGRADVVRRLGSIPSELETASGPYHQKDLLSLGDRGDLRHAAWNIQQEQPWYGVGGWGFRYLLALHVPASEWGYVQAPGKANVHCDPVQFLVEFGRVGCGLLLSGLAVLLWPILQLLVLRPQVSGLRSQVSGFRPHLSSFIFQTSPFTGFALLGLFIVSLHSLIDLPFRCPALLYTWSFIWAAIPKAAGDRSQCQS